jgi:hypothetical protein
MRWMPRLRLLLARRPWIYWLTVAVLAATVAAAVASSAADLDRQRNAWGQTVTVFVANTALAPGDPIGGALSATKVPLAMIPDSALRDQPDPGATALQHIAPGEIVVGIDVAAGDGPTALLPPGWMAITIDAGEPDVFRLGDHVAVLAGGAIVAADGVVVRLVAAGVVVGVSAEVGAAVADAAVQHTAVVAISASPSPRSPG